MRILALVDKNWGIGKNGQLLVSIPEDMKLFREETQGNVVVMGRKTLESLPNSSALVGRTNIVLTRDMSYTAKNVIICHSVEEVLGQVKEYTDKEIYIIGGETIYSEFLPYCDTADITRVDYEYDADVHFPDLDADEEWEVTAVSEEKTYFDIIYEFVRFERKKTDGKK